MNLFDSHCHLENEGFQNDLPEVMQRMAQAGVRRCVLGGSDLETSRRIVALAKKHEGVYGAVGVHPHEAKTWTDETEAELEDMLTQPRVVAVGEIGLDHYWDTESDEVQRKWFVRQLELAKEVNLPVIIHSREASQETFDIMKEHHAGSTGGVIHCYSYSPEMAQEYVKMGYFIGVGGVVTLDRKSVV